MNSYTVKKLAEQRVKVGSRGDPVGPAREGSNSNVSMPAPKAMGHPSMPAATTHDEYFGREFRAESDLRVLLAAARIKGDKQRLNDALHRFRELKGANNQGVRTRTNNAFDNVKLTTTGTSGSRADTAVSGGRTRSRW
jgi:hypothetical protein